MGSPRSRRRRPTFGIFGARRRATAVSASGGQGDAGASELAVTGDAHQRPGAADGEQQASAEAIVARLRREVLADPRLRARAPEQELAWLVDDAVRTLWRDSNVKAFVAVLAMRRIRERLGLPEEDQDENLGTSA